MNASFVALAIPVFMALLAIEALVARARMADKAYRFADTIANMSCGIGQQVIEPFLKVLTLVPYAWLWSHARVFDISARSFWAWAALVLASDLAFYTYHRAAHRVGFLWASHAVHHQSEELNLSVAFRQPWLRAFFEPIFFLPLAVIGFPPAMYVAGITIALVYQFWLHTRVIGRLGPLEWVLNTPSNHRVHHGINPEYLDKNYGGIFVIWDHLFGSFAREEREPVYGTVKPLASWDTLRANLAVWRDLLHMSRATHSLRDKLRVWIAPPEWRPADLGGPHVVPPVDRRTHPRYDTHVPRGIQAYVAAQTVIAGLGLILFLRAEATAAPALVVTASLLFVASIASWGALLERRRRAWRIEGARLAAVAAMLVWIAS